jgi:hypothetical protein
MKTISILCLFFSALLMSCSTTEKVKTTKVYIEIGGSSNLTTNHSGNQVVAHKSKKSYSGFQHKTSLSQGSAYSTDSTSKPVK